MDIRLDFQCWMQQHTLANAPSSESAMWAVPLVDLGLIQATGPEAIHFLHNQLTNDLENLSESSAQLTAYCNPKGRMLADFTIWKTTSAVNLLVDHTILPMIQKRLNMFILRAQVRLTDLTQSVIPIGLGGQGTLKMMRSLFGTLPETNYGIRQTENMVCIRLPSHVHPIQWLILGQMEFVQSYGNQFEWVTPAYWQWTQIQAGIPHITAATQEKFVPQMINWDAIQGVSFNKGCYPGQEVVARSHYLGKLKRRMAIAHIEAEPPAIGSDIFYKQQACGLVVNAAPDPTGGSACLVELPLEIQEQGEIRCTDPNGPILQFLPLPYSLPASR